MPYTWMPEKAKKKNGIDQSAFSQQRSHCDQSECWILQTIRDRRVILEPSEAPLLHY